MTQTRLPLIFQVKVTLGLVWTALFGMQRVYVVSSVPYYGDVGSVATDKDREKNVRSMMSRSWRNDWSNPPFKITWYIFLDRARYVMWLRMETQLLKNNQFLESSVLSGIKIPGRI